MQKQTMTDKQTAVLEEIMVSRRTTRHFADDSPSKQEIEAVIKAGHHAPYAIIGTKGIKHLRKFIVLYKDSPNVSLFRECWNQLQN